MCGKFHTPLQMGQVMVIISCQIVINQLFLKQKMSLQKQLWQPNLQTFFDWFLVLVRWKINSFCQRCCKKNFSPFCSASLEIIGVKVCNRQTDKFFDTILRSMWIFLSVKFATSLIASLAGGLYLYYNRLCSLSTCSNWPITSSWVSWL